MFYVLAYPEFAPADRGMLRKFRAEFEPERAIATLPDLLQTREERQRAVEVVEFIAGAIEEMEPVTIQTLQKYHAALGLHGFSKSVTTDPLKVVTTQREVA